MYAIRYASREGRRGEHFHGYDETSADPHPTAYYVWLAVSPRRCVLVDAGLDPARAATLAGLDYLCSPVDAVAELGVSPGDVDHLVLTHLHHDHTGTAAAFPSARYVLQRTEIDYWTGHWAKRIRAERWLVSEDDLGHLLDPRAEHRLRIVDGDHDVVPGLSVHHVGGHTAGMQVVRVHTARGWVVLASDASHFYENIEQDRPFAILNSIPGAYAAFDRITELADGPELVVAGHDPLVLRRFPPASRTHAGRIARIA